MVFGIARPTSRSGSSNIYFRGRIPVEVMAQARGQTLVIPVGDQIARIQLSNINHCAILRRHYLVQVTLMPQVRSAQAGAARARNVREGVIAVSSRKSMLSSFERR
jgi:hypothetical protein